MKYCLSSYTLCRIKMYEPTAVVGYYKACCLRLPIFLQRFYKKAAAFVLRAVAKHSPDLAQAVVDSNALEMLVPCLEEFDPTVKEAAAWAIGYIAQHTPGLAQHVVDAGAVPLLVLCIQEPEITLKRISASSMGDICKHSPELAQSVVDAGAVAYLAPLILHPDAKLKRQVCGALAHISKHSVDLAEVVVEAEIFPNILNCLKDTDTMVRKNAAMCIREIAKHTPELSKLIVNSGGAAALVDYVFEAHGNNKLPGIMAIGYIAAFSETLALAVIVSKAIPPLKDALVTEPEDHIKAACAWTLGQIGRHTPDHARALAEGDVLRHLLACMVHEESSEDLKTKAKRALKAILAKCTHLTALQPLLRDSPVKVQKYVLRQFAQLLPHDVEARRSFVQVRSILFIGSPCYYAVLVCLAAIVCTICCDASVVFLPTERRPPVPAGAERDGRRQADGVHHADQQLLPARGGGVLLAQLLQDAAAENRRVPAR
jgi:3-methyladenine DNA glycosylase AlkD